MKKIEQDIQAGERKYIPRYKDLVWVIALWVSLQLPAAASAHDEDTSMEQVRSYNERCETLREETQGRRDCNDFFVAQEVLWEIQSGRYEEIQNQLQWFTLRAPVFSTE